MGQATISATGDRPLPCCSIRDAAVSQPVSNEVSGMIHHDAPGPVGPVKPDYASARPERSWANVNLFNVFIGVSVPTAIVALAVAVAMPSCGSRHTAKHDLTRAKIAANKTPIELYRQHMGTYPASLNDLVTRPAVAGTERRQGPYVTNLDDLKDAWGRPFRYHAPGSRNPGPYDLWSAGPDGVDGTKDDICNWR
jgi:general secretion pathway protein G